MATGNSKSHYAEEMMLKSFLLGTTYTAPTEIWLGLFTASPGEGSTDNPSISSFTNEVSTSGGSLYARQPITFSAPVPNSGGGATGTVCSQSANITFPVAGANWGTISYVAIVDNATAGSGNVLYYQALTTPQVVNTGNQFVILAGNITVEED